MFRLVALDKALKEVFVFRLLWLGINYCVVEGRSSVYVGGCDQGELELLRLFLQFEFLSGLRALYLVRLNKINSVIFEISKRMKENLSDQHQNF